MILKLQNAGKFITTSGSGYIPPSRNIIPSKKSPTAATINQWLKGTFSYITGIKDSDLIESKYRPSKETNTTTKYYTRKGLDYDVMRNLLGGKESSAKTFEGEPLYYKNFNDLYNRLSNKTYRKGRLLRTTDNSHLGEYTIGIGEDNNGRYVSYYDKFDWAPNEKLEIFSPYEIYNRIYEKDFNRMLKELNNETYSGSNPSGNWFFKSGSDNKGYLKKGGLIKSANARKWKHENGGLFPSLKVKKHLAFVPGASITDSNPKAYKYLKKHKYSSGGFLKDVGDFLKSNSGMLDLGKSLFSGISDYKQTSSLLDGYLNKIAANADLQYEQALMDAEIERQKTTDIFTNTTGEVINKGVETVANGWLPFSLKVTAAKRKLDLLNATVDLLIRDAKGQALGNMFGTFVLNGLGTLTNILG